MTIPTDPSSHDAARRRRVWILVTASTCTALHASTLTMVNVALPQLQGALSATQDEVARVVTWHAIAAAVATPLTGWLVGRLGERTILIWATIGFGISSFLCATAETLGPMLAYRVLQGMFGAPFVPVATAVLLAAYPLEERAWSQSIYGIAVVVAQAMSPALGGYLAEILDWRWIFFLTLPFAAASLLLVAAFIDNDARQERKLDWTGFLLLAITIVCLQLLLDRGERSDWFESTEIVAYGITGAASLCAFILHSATAQRPFVSPRLILDRNFSIGTLLVFAYGMLAFVPLVLLPTLLKDLKGYPDSLIGLVLAMRGVGMLVGFFVAARISQRTARPAMVVGLLLVGASGLLIGLADLNVSAYHVEMVTFLQGLGTGILWVPITLVAFQTLPPSLLPEGSALFHLGRQIGTSLFVSLSVMVVLRTSTISYAELAASISSHREVLKLPFAIGAFDVESAHGLARLSAEMSRQARMIGYVNAFMLYSAISVACLGLLALIRKPAPSHA